MKHTFNFILAFWLALELPMLGIFSASVLAEHTETLATVALRAPEYRPVSEIKKIADLPENKALPRREDAYSWINVHENIFKRELLKTLVFDKPESVAKLRALHDCKLSCENGVLVVESRGEDPYLLVSEQIFDEIETEQIFGKHSTKDDEATLPKQICVRIITRSEKSVNPRIYWTDADFPGFTEERAQGTVAIKNEPLQDGWQVREASCELNPGQTMRMLRLDPADAPGRCEIKKIEFFLTKRVLPEVSPFPAMSIKELNTSDAFPTESQKTLLSLVKETPGTVMVNGKSVHFEAGETRVFTYDSDPTKPLDRCVWKVSVTGEDASIIATECVMEVIHDVKIDDTWTVIHGKSFDYCVAPSGEIAFLVRNGKKIAALTHPEIQKLHVQISENGLEFDGNEPLPIIRLPGKMQYAVVPGLEILEAGEWSSSRADLVIPEHRRFRPARHLITQTWMGAITTDGAFRLDWEDTRFQPVFATPNYFDATHDVRLALECSDTNPLNGKQEAHPKKSKIVLTFSPNTDETAFLGEAFNSEWAKARRESGSDSGSDSGKIDTKTLFSLYRNQLENGVIQSEKGWGHCAGSHWIHSPAGDMASALWRIGGNVPDFLFNRGGAHVENSTIFFLRGQAGRWRTQLVGAAEHALANRQKDGTWRYLGKYAVTHFDTTALGVNTRQTWTLLRAYTVTGDEKFLTPALETLEICRGFHVARGAQCWEMPLHTPDPLACAYAVASYTLAYQITQNPQFLDDARRWALEGATYVYLWDGCDNPWQFGAYIGVLGATNWKSPNWIGRPVQWIGTVYAYAILNLAEALPADSSERAQWCGLAEAITASTERQIYPDGEFSGLLPDSVDCVQGTRYPWNINPAVPIALRLRLDGQQDGLRFLQFEAENQKYFVVSPFPTRHVEKNVLEIKSPPNLTFQILVNGHVRNVGENTSRIAITPDAP